MTLLNPGVVSEPGGRRSRRGFAYQDVVTLLDLLRLLDGDLETVEWESREDIFCQDATGPIYRQVKTNQGSRRHSIATVCANAPQKNGSSNGPNSILAKLFGATEIPDGTRFHLVLNESPAADLAQFAPQVDRSDPGHIKSREELAKRLADVKPACGRSVEWCIDQFSVHVLSRSPDELEREAATQVALRMRSISGPPLHEQATEVVDRLLSRISRDAHASSVATFTPDAISAIFREITLHVCGLTNQPAPPLPTLESKLKPVGMPPAEVEEIKRSWVLHNSKYRQATGSQRTDLDHLLDEVHGVCMTVSALRRAGEISPGAEAFAETLKQIRALPLVSSGTVTTSTALGALHIVTARCGNRYADA